MAANPKSTTRNVKNTATTTRYTPPFRTLDNYYINGDSVCYDRKSGPVKVTVNGIPYVYLCTTDGVTREVSYVIRGYSIVSGNFEAWISCNDLHSATKLCEFLAHHGIVVMNQNATVEYIKGSTQKVSPTHFRTLVHEVGWCFGDQAFFDGRTLIHSNNLPANGYYLRPDPETPVNVKGTLEDWKANIGRHVEANPVLLVCVMLAFTSYLLPQAGLPSRIFNLHGIKGQGKTLALQVAATVIGNGVDPAAGAMAEHCPVVQKLETTINGIEPVLSRSSPFLLPLDELTEQSVAMIAELMYKLASGAGRHRMTSTGGAAQKHVWRLIILTSSERSISESVELAKKPLLGGQADRGVDIPLDRIGVVRAFGEYSSFDGVTRHLKKVCSECYGTPGQAFIRFAINNPDDFQTCIDSLPEIETKLAPRSCGPGERRVVKYFAAAVAAACIANLAGILDCGYDQIMEAVKLVINEWWRARGNALQRIGQYLLEHDDCIHSSKPELGWIDAAAFVWDGNIIIPQDAFRLYFGDEQRELLSELASLGALITEQRNRHASRFCNNRLFAYVIPENRVAEAMGQSLNDDTSNETT